MHLRKSKHEHMQKQDLLIMSHSHDLKDSAKLGQNPTWDELLQVGNKVDQKIGRSTSKNNIIKQSNIDE